MEVGSIEFSERIRIKNLNKEESLVVLIITSGTQPISKGKPI